MNSLYHRKKLVLFQAPPPISTGSTATAASRRPRPQTLTDSTSTEHLSMVGDGGGLNSAGSLHDGGHVRFVDSTIR